MNKRGFTIMEVVTVIALISLVGSIVVLNINKILKKSNADQLEEVRQQVADASEVYLGTKCGYNDYNKLINDGSIKIYLSSIRNCGLIDDQIYNPVNKEYFDIKSEYIIVSIDEVGFKEYNLSF